MKFLKAYVGVLVVFVIFDAVWLGVIAVDFYAETIGHLMAENVNWGAAAVFYVVYIGGIAYFVSIPAAATGDLKKAALNGVLFGIIAYGTYDLTNFATLRDWPLKVVIYDMIWGGFITASAAIGGFLATRRSAAAEAQNGSRG